MDRPPAVSDPVIAAVLHSRGLGQAFDRWDDDVPEVMAWTFE